MRASLEDLKELEKKGNYDPNLMDENGKPVHTKYEPGKINLSCCTLAGLIRLANCEVHEEKFELFMKSVGNEKYTEAETCLRPKTRS